MIILLENQMVWQNRKKTSRILKMRVKGEEAKEFNRTANIGEDGASFSFELYAMRTHQNTTRFRTLNLVFCVEIINM
jgi:hypothetical protein